MSEPGQIIGDIAAGALAARAIEPAHGEAGDPGSQPGAGGHTHERACLNCGTALVGSHCHQCGQAAHVHRTIGAFFHDLLHGVFHFEGKIWRTLPMLAWHPGRLTREYIDGRRASYISPIALFLFVVFLTFALFNLASGPMHFGNAGAGNVPAATRIADLKQQIAKAKAAGQPTDDLESALKKADLAQELQLDTKSSLPETIATSESSGDPLGARINEAWREAKANPDLAIYKLQSSAYKYSWLLIPLSVPFLWLLFPFNRRFHLYDHTVFVTYSLSFMLIVLAAITAINVWTGLGGLIALLLLYVPFHMHRQLREAYGLGRMGALWRTVALSWFALVALVLWAMAILGLTIG